MELWGAEYQESNALLLRPSDKSYLERVCRREKCPVDFVGHITGDGKVCFIILCQMLCSRLLQNLHQVVYLLGFFFAQIVLVDDEGGQGEQADRVRHPVDLQLEWVLGKMPQKEFKLERLAPILQPLTLPAELTIRDALQRVLRLPAVASKRYLTNKVVT